LLGRILCLHDSLQKNIRIRKKLRFIAAVQIEHVAKLLGIGWNEFLKVALHQLLGNLRVYRRFESWCKQTQFVNVLGIIMCVKAGKNSSERTTKYKDNK
jgi:hypothetical protein